ncbi:S1 RNA-binding domain-containing protein [Streptosporangium canum]|uniref:S1 RNA-binding domain-containing protein n=1 Tax=Streptosporangium canum TaxID=324952 RepID=UPI00341F1618
MTENSKIGNRRGVLGGLQIGQVRKGVVTSVVDSGAFVDLGGVDGLVSVPNLSWRRIGDDRRVRPCLGRCGGAGAHL